MRRYNWAFTVILIGVTISIIIDLYIPLQYKRLFDTLSGSSHDLKPLILILLTVLVAKIISELFYRIAHFTQNFAIGRTMADLQNTCFTHLHGHSYGFFNNSFTGSLTRKVTRYADSFEDIIDRSVWSIWPAILTLTVATTVLFQKSWILGSGILGWTAIYGFANYKLVTYKLRYDVRRVEADTAVSAHLTDTLSNHLNLKLFNGNHQERRTFANLTNQLFVTQRKAWDTDATYQTFQGVFMFLLEFGILSGALFLWKQGSFSIGDFALLQAYILQINFQLWNVGRNLHKIYEQFASAGEMTTILETVHEIQDQPGAASLEATGGRVTFQNVSFAYQENQHIFTDFNLRVKAGERIALVGSSGSGKSTLVKLLFRFADIQKGTISIDGKDITAITQDSLRSALALVPQEPLLFHRTIRENISYARPEASFEEVVIAAKAAHCDEFISRFPDKYETLVGERGVKLSGGERQRIAIARALLKNAPILVLDEATSSLDSHSEHLIQDALTTLMCGKTTIVIAHRLSTIMQMDTIYVMDEGKIIEHGNHQELLARKDGAYRKLWNIQAGGFLSND